LGYHLQNTVAWDRYDATKVNQASNSEGFIDEEEKAVYKSPKKSHFDRPFLQVL